MADSNDSVWRGLEEIDGLAATKRHWAVSCGQPLFNFVEPFLTPTGERAEWIPDPTDRSRQMRVIPAFRGKDGEFIAISEEEPRSPDVPLSAIDLAVYGLDLPRFGRQIAASLGFESDRPLVMLSGNTARLAFMPSHELEVVLVIPCRADDLPRALDSIRLKFHGGLALITPTEHTVPPHIRSAIETGSFQHATLSQLLSVTENGTLSAVWDMTKFFTPSKKRDNQDDNSDSSESHEGLGKLIEQGFQSLRKQTIEDAISANEMRKELEDISGRADNFMTDLVTGFGGDRDMADLFMRLLAVGENGKPLSYAMVGDQIGITKQAVEARFKKMADKFPIAHRHLKTLRTSMKTKQFSAISPTERRKKGVDGVYDYDAD